MTGEGCVWWRRGTPFLWHQGRLKKSEASNRQISEPKTRQHGRMCAFSPYNLLVDGVCALEICRFLASLIFSLPGTNRKGLQTQPSSIIFHWKCVPHARVLHLSLRPLPANALLSRKDAIESIRAPMNMQYIQPLVHSLDSRGLGLVVMRMCIITVMHMQAPAKVSSWCYTCESTKSCFGR